MRVWGLQLLRSDTDGLHEHGKKSNITGNGDNTNRQHSSHHTFTKLVAVLCRNIAVAVKVADNRSSGKE